MHPTFATHVKTLEPARKRLLASPPLRCAELPKQMPKSGVYLFTERGRHLYVGRSDRMRSRVSNHGNPCATYRQGAFAKRLAHEETGTVKPTYRSKGGRKEQAREPAFVAAFTKAKRRIARMDVRFVEEQDPVRQALLEIYVATTLNTPHNSFKNH